MYLFSTLYNKVDFWTESLVFSYIHMQKSTYILHWNFEMKNWFVYFFTHFTIILECKSTFFFIKLSFRKGCISLVKKTANQLFTSKFYCTKYTLQLTKLKLLVIAHVEKKLQVPASLWDEGQRLNVFVRRI